MFGSAPCDVEDEEESGEAPRSRQQTDYTGVPLVPLHRMKVVNLNVCRLAGQRGVGVSVGGSSLHSSRQNAWQ